jgi:outer membrane immunogenic protein
MRRILLTAAAVALSSSFAMAADMPAPSPVYKAPPMAVPVIYNWSGFYMGGNAGYAWGNESSTLSIADTPNGGGIGGHFNGTNGVFTSNDSVIAANAGSPSFNPTGFTGGGQIGYNWQASNWVYGIEADFNSFQQRQTTNNSVGLPGNTTLLTCGNPAPSCVGNFSTSVSTNWLLTVRPRIGYAWDRTLIYGTAGLAVTQLNFSQSYSDNISHTGNNCIGPCDGLTTTASSTKAGWVVGGGVEQALMNHWSVKAEYLYIRFSGLSASGVLYGNVPKFTANFTNNVDHLSSNILRAGLNYKF